MCVNVDTDNVVVAWLTQQMCVRDNQFILLMLCLNCQSAGNQLQTVQEEKQMHRHTTD